MKSIWVIEQGDYSDYRVCGVFSTLANPKKMQEKINAGDSYDKATIAKWTLDPGIEELNAGRRMFSVRMNYDGNVEHVEDGSSYEYAQGAHLRVWKRTKAPAWRNQPIGDAVTGTVWATDEKHAIKIVNEFRAQAIAGNEMHERREG